MASSELEEDHSVFLNPVNSSAICEERMFLWRLSVAGKLISVPADEAEKEKGNGGRPWKRVISFTRICL